MKRVDMSLINENMIKQSNEQEAQSSFSASWSKDFPVMKTPVDQKVIVYFPKDWQSRKHELLMHSIKKGNSSVYMRCISGLSAGYESLGYTGECPACQAMESVWEAYNAKLKIQAKHMGIDPDNDPTEVLKGVKENLRKEMAISGSDKFMVFPVVIIPTDANGTPVLDGSAKPEPVYVIWKSFRWDTKMGDEECMEGITDPSGHFFRWNFKYATKDGKKPNARDAARELKCRRITDQAALDILAQQVELAEALVAPFTQAQAVEQIKCANFYYYEDSVAEVKSVMRATESFIASLANGAGDAQALGTSVPVGAIGGGSDPASLVNSIGNNGVMGIGQPVQNASGVPQVGGLGIKA